MSIMIWFVYFIFFLALSGLGLFGVSQLHKVVSHQR